MLASRELRPGVDAEVRLREQQHAGDGAVRKRVERLADDSRTARARGCTQDAVQRVLVGQDAASRTHASIA